MYVQSYIFVLNWKWFNQSSYGFTKSDHLRRVPCVNCNMSFQTAFHSESFFTKFTFERLFNSWTDEMCVCNSLFIVYPASQTSHLKGLSPHLMIWLIVTCQVQRALQSCFLPSCTVVLMWFVKPYFDLNLPLNENGSFWKNEVMCG